MDEGEWKWSVNLKIVDINIEELSRASRRGRVRSAETQQLMNAIDALKSGAAKAIVLGSGDNPAKVRARIAYAGRLAGKRLQIAVESDRILFGLSDRPARRRRRRKSSK